MLQRWVRMASPRRRRPLRLGLAALCALTACAQRHESSVVDPVSVQVARLEAEALLAAALDPVPQSEAERASRLVELFELAGCPKAQLFLARIRGSRNQHIVCALPGASEHSILVGAQTGGTRFGSPASDDWSGLSMLPLLYRALAGTPREHGFLFAGLGDDAGDPLGSESELESMRPIDRAQLAAIVNLRGLGLGSSAVWSSVADPDLRLDLVSVSRSLGLELRHVDLSRAPEQNRRVRRSPWSAQGEARAFRRYQIPSITIHSYDRETARLLTRAPREEKANLFRREAYAETLRLVSVYLGYLDQTLALRRGRGY